MRTFIYSFFLFAIVQTNSQAQITLENTYIKKVSTVLLESVGTKYSFFDRSTFQLKLYNLDHSIYKTITIQNPTTNLYDTSVYNLDIIEQTYYIKEGLFDTDSEIEFMLYMGAYDAGYTNYKNFTAIVNEDGTIIMKKEKATPAGLLEYELRAIVKASNNQTKMVLDYYGLGNGYGNPDSTQIYNLPGTLYCDSCSTVTGARRTNYIGDKIELNNYPNPATTYTIIEYKLPEELREATLKIYSMNGVELKSYQVDHQFDYLKISTETFPNGAYYYQITGDNGKQLSKKMVVAK